MKLCMKFFAVAIIACLYLTACQKKGPLGYDVGEVYEIYSNNHNDWRGKLRIVDAGEDYITVVYWDEEAGRWGEKRSNFSKESLGKSANKLRQVN